MRTFRHHLILTALLCAVALSTGLAQTTFTIVHVNDSHSHLDAFGPKDAQLNGTIGGLAKAATVIGTLRATREHTLVLHGGDVFTGDLFFNEYFGAPEFALLAQLGFDAMTVGNHELDLGPDVLAMALAEASALGGAPQLLSANIVVPPAHPLASAIMPAITRRVGDIKIGIFGLTIPNPLNNPDPLVVDDRLDSVAYVMAALLRADTCDVVICMSHCGVYIDHMLAAGIPGIDVIVGAHDHYVLQQPLGIDNPGGTKTWIVQAGSCYRQVGEMTLTYDNGTLELDDYLLHEVDADVPAEPGVQGMVDQLKAGIELRFPGIWGPAIATAADDIEEVFDAATPERDTPAGNLVTDAYFAAYPDADIAITALGLIADKLYRGPIVPADVFRIVSYGFDEATRKGLRLYTCSITGMELLKGLEVGVGELDAGDDFVIQVGGMRFEYDGTLPQGARVNYASVLINGAPVDPMATYSLVTNEAIIGLLGGYGVTVSDIVPGVFEYDAVLAHITSLGTLTAAVGGRMRDITDVQTVSQPVALDLRCAPQPVIDAATVGFTLDRPGVARITVHDMLGRCVATPVDGYFAIGSHHATLHMGTLPAGVYLLHLSSGDGRAVRRLAVVR